MSETAVCMHKALLVTEVLAMEDSLTHEELASVLVNSRLKVNLSCTTVFVFGMNPQKLVS